MASLTIEPVGHTRLALCRLDPGEPVVLGRGEHCRLRVDDPGVSKEHVRLECLDGAWHLTDLGSSNGTTVNHWTLAADNPIRLRDGDTFAAGPCGFRVALNDRPPPVGRSSAPPPVHTGTYATRASIFLRLRDERSDVQELGWAEFRERYAPVIIGFCRNAGIPAQDAEDVLQDVMLGFFRIAPEFEYDPSRGRFRGYLKRSTLNAVRKRARAGRGAATASDDWIEAREASADPDWERSWSEQMLERAMAEARTRFDVRTIEAFDLYGRRGVPAEEVAARLGLSVNGVHQAKSRVTSVVRAVVERLRADEG